MSFIEHGEVIKTVRINGKTFRTSFRAPEIATAAKAGQFVMLNIGETLDPLLPRAFSICDVKDEIVDLLYVAVGKATSRIAQMKGGERVRFVGPLGNGFPTVNKLESVWVVVGGSGAAVLPILTRSIGKAGASYRIFYGTRTEGELIAFGDMVFETATDDGSAGFHGNVIDLVKRELKQTRPDKIFVCGPTSMLKVAQIEFSDIRETYISVETPMACGIGLCQGCAVKKAGADDYFLACKDGPVFRSDEILFEE
ncbi:MAG: dihydroorotate dehydrogenase electron transfer subunit [Candidatus Kryptoniota bacterium]